MEDKRQFRGWESPKDKANIMCEKLQEEVEVIDMSAGGIRLSCSNPPQVGSIVYAQLRIVPQVKPFYVMGRVTRVFPKNGLFEVAIKFEKISTLQISSK